MFTQRVIGSVFMPEDVYQKEPLRVLETMQAHNMVGLLRQLSQLTEYSADVFKNLFEESTAVYDRVRSIGSRIDALESTVPEVERTFQAHEPSYFYARLKGKEWRSSNTMQQSLFSPKTQPVPVQARRAATQAPPKVSLMDQIANKQCLLEYSNPGLFFELWFKEEEERLKAIREANRQKKKKKKTKVTEVKKREVEAIQVTVYSARGKEFEPVSSSVSSSSVLSPASKKQAGRLIVEDVEEDDEKPGPSTAPRPSGSAPVTPARTEVPASHYTGATQRDYYSQPASIPAPHSQSTPTSPVHVSAPPPSATPQRPVGPPMGAPPTSLTGPVGRPTPQPVSQPVYSKPAPPTQTYVPTFTPPPMDTPPEAPPLESGPDAPPMDSAPDAPDAPPLTFSASGSASSAPPRPGGLLGEITAGRQLRKVQQQAVEPAAPSGRDGLLSEIRSAGISKLKKVEKTEEKKGPAMGGAMGSVMAILQRRAAISGSSEDEEPKSGVVGGAGKAAKKDEDEEEEEEDWDP